MGTIAEEERKLALELEAEDAALEAAERGEPEQTKAPEPEPESELRRDPPPLLIDVPANADQHLAALSNSKAEVIRQFEDGEITAREYSDALEAIDDRREDIRGRQRWAKAARDANERALDSAWRSEVDRFMSKQGRNIRERGEPAIIAFDSYVKRVTGDAANARLSDKAQLAKAHKLFLADFGGSFSAGQEDGRSAGGRTDFAALDRLAESNPREFELRVAGMTDDEREAYGL